MYPYESRSLSYNLNCKLAWRRGRARFGAAPAPAWRCASLTLVLPVLRGPCSSSAQGAARRQAAGPLLPDSLDEHLARAPGGHWVVPHLEHLGPATLLDHHSSHGSRAHRGAGSRGRNQNAKGGSRRTKREDVGNEVRGAQQLLKTS